jgi:uncharacterized protein involved in high-affinity Fe2+ transport
MTNQPTDLINFECDHCATNLTVPQSMAGVSGPCPSCANAVTAPSPSAVSPLAIVPATAVAPRLGKVQCRRSLAYAGLCAAVAGVAWSAWRMQTPHGCSTPLANAVSSVPVDVLVPANPKVAALDRSTAAIKKFLATTTWEAARSLIATQDTPGDAPSDAFVPRRFNPLANEGIFKPVSVTSKENAGQYQIIWEIENPHDAEKLVMTADDTPEGVRIRWYQPPYFIASQKGTKPNNSNEAVAQVNAAPAGLPVREPQEVPGSSLKQAEVIMAAIDVPPSAGNGSAPLNNAAAKLDANPTGTASTKSPKGESKAPAALK